VPKEREVGEREERESIKREKVGERERKKRA
jgi:hypothetical protein